MANDYDEYNQFDRPGNEADPGRISTARRRTAMPGMILIILGLIGIGVETTSLVVAQTNPSYMYDQIRSFILSTPPSKDRDDQLKQIDDQKDALMLNTPTNIGSCVLGGILNLLMMLGGASMRKLGSYGLAITGAICSLIPMSGCICCAMPFGLWAVIVLADGTVREAFRAQKRLR